MDQNTLILFFQWCVIINGGLLIVWTCALAFVPDLVYRLQSRWVPLSRQEFTALMYAFLALFKILFLIFNLVPYLVLLIIF